MKYSFTFHHPLRESRWHYFIAPFHGKSPSCRARWQAIYDLHKILVNTCESLISKNLEWINDAANEVKTHQPVVRHMPKAQLFWSFRDRFQKAVEDPILAEDDFLFSFSENILKNIDSPLGLEIASFSNHFIFLHQLNVSIAMVIYNTFTQFEQWTFYKPDVSTAENEREYIRIRNARLASINHNGIAWLRDNGEWRPIGEGGEDSTVEDPRAGISHLDRNGAWYTHLIAQLNAFDRQWRAGIEKALTTFS